MPKLHMSKIALGPNRHETYYELEIYRVVHIYSNTVDFNTLEKQMYMVLLPLLFVP